MTRYELHVVKVSIGGAGATIPDDARFVEVTYDEPKRVSEPRHVATIKYLKPVETPDQGEVRQTMTENETPPPKSAEEIEELRDRIAAIVTSDEVESGSQEWQKLEAAEATLDWVLGEADGFTGLVDEVESERLPDESTFDQGANQN